MAWITRLIWRALKIGIVLGLVACSQDEPASKQFSQPQAVEPGASPGATPTSRPAASDVPVTIDDTSAATPERGVVASEEPAASTTDDESEPPTHDNAPQQHIVKGVVTQWAPMVLFVKPGDQLVFRQMTGHDSETIEGMIPEGAETWKSKLGQEGFAVSPSVPGIYMYKCNPHVGLGMIGAIAVGDPPYANLDAIEAHPQNKGMIGRAIRKLKQALASHDGA
jgi:pseudoazurin